MGWDFRHCLRGQGDKTFKGTCVPNSFKCFGKSHPRILHACFVVSHCPVNQSTSSAFGVTGSDDLWSRERSLIMMVVRAPPEERWLICSFKKQFSIQFHLIQWFPAAGTTGLSKVFPRIIILAQHCLCWKSQRSLWTSLLKKTLKQATNILQK